jgi:hypothetical protein
MATVDKDFKVKNGIQVSGNAVIGGTITAADPTSDSHVVTLGYLNANSTSGSLPVASTAPSSPVNGTTYIDSVTKRINIYVDGAWLTMAAIDDTLVIPQHIHDTSIDGSGLIVSTFTEGGSITSAQSSPVDGGGVSTTTWTALLDGGSATDNFN